MKTVKTTEELLVAAQEENKILSKKLTTKLTAAQEENSALYEKLSAAEKESRDRGLKIAQLQSQIVELVSMINDTLDALTAGESNE